MGIRNTWSSLAFLVASLLPATGCRFTPQHLAHPGTYGAGRIQFDAPEWSKRTADYYVHIDNKYACGPSPEHKHQGSWSVAVQINPADCGDGVIVPPGRHRIAAGRRATTSRVMNGTLYQQQHYVHWSYADVEVPQNSEIECHLRGGSVKPFEPYEVYEHVSITCTATISAGGF